MKKKGDVLEEIIALMHKYPDIVLQRNVRIKPISGNGRPREFDIILNQKVAGYKIKIPIECKNYPKKKIDASFIDQYVGKLQSVGLPVSLSVYVTSGEYTKGAIERAKQSGIELLTLDGLNKDGLAPTIMNALENISFQSCEIKEFAVITGIDSKEVPHRDNNLFNKEGKFIGNLLDIIWNSWVHGFPKKKIGKYIISLGKDFGFKTKSVSGNLINIEKLHIVLFVSRYLISNKINTSLLVLNGIDGKPQKVHFSKHNCDDGKGIPLYHFQDEIQFEEFEKRSGDVKIHLDVRLNRVKLGTMYWPPSREYKTKVEEAKEEMGSGELIVTESKSIVESINDELDPEWLAHYNKTFKHLNPYYFQN